MAVTTGVTETKSLTSHISNWQATTTIYRLLLEFTSAGQDCGELRGSSWKPRGYWEGGHGAEGYVLRRLVCLSNAILHLGAIWGGFFGTWGWWPS